ncbi:MAG: PHP domain-containing protein [Oscillospiraceae bacterium]|nr:PHP domain-containing protein [Oscillospiraceae bacterium]
MFKTETHLHTSEASPCSHVDAAEMVRLYHEAGYKTVIITDHLKQKYLDAFEESSWEKAVERFFLGYRNAKEAGDKLGVNVLMGAEFELGKIPNHYLVYGITPEILVANPNIYNVTAKEFYEVMKRNGVFVVQAHPYRDGGSFPTPDCADGFEIYNSNPRHTDFSEKSEATAKEHNLYVTAGSDAHRLNDYGISGMLSENEIKTIEEFIELVKSGKGQLIR